MINNAQYKQLRLQTKTTETLSDRTYNLAIGCILLIGFFLNYILATYFSEQILQLNIFVIIIGYLIISIGSIIVIHKSNNPIISFIGFLFLSLAMGTLLVFILQCYTKTTITQALLTTTIVTALMIIIATIYPTFFIKLGRVLIICLLASIIIEILLTIIFHKNPIWIDYIVAIIFCGYIGFDWSMAQQYPKTLDNAIDSAADIYIDIINLFIRLLEIFGRRND